MRWGIAGTGVMAGGFLHDLRLVDDVEVVAVGSRRPETALAFAESHGIGRGGTYADLVADPEVDVVYVATPHPHHHELALALAARGKHLLVEKAFTATLAGAEEVVAAVRGHGVFCMEAMWTRFLPAVARARDLVATGAIGDLHHVHADFAAYRAYDPTHRLFARELGGGAVLDLGVYVISIAQHFLGAPDAVTVCGTSFPNGADATVGMLLKYDDGRAASLMTSLVSQSGGRATLVGTEGTLELAPPFHHPSTIVLRHNGEPPEEIVEPPLGHGYAHEVIEVERCVAAGWTESPVMPLADTLAVQAVLQEALDQLGINANESATLGLA